MKRAIITGATGVVGTALIKELIENDVELLVLLRQGSHKNVRIPEHPLITKKFCSLNELSVFQNDTGKEYDVFYHFAWAATAGPDRNNMYAHADNIKYALDAVEVAKRFGCKLFIGAGSQAEYGRHEGILNPGTPCFPENGYGMAKLCAGQMTRGYAHQLGLKHIWTRILSVYGPNDGENTMVMSLINKLQKGETPALTKGEQMWDYLYSADAARAFRLLGEKGVDGKTYMIGSGEARPLKEYMKIIRDVVRPDAQLEFGTIPYSGKQVMYLCADIELLTTDTGWKPTASFEEGIEKTVKFHIDLAQRW